MLDESTDVPAILTPGTAGEAVTGPALLLYKEELIRASGPLQENRWASNAQTLPGTSVKGASLSPSGRENSPERQVLSQLKGEVFSQQLSL